MALGARRAVLGLAVALALLVAGVVGLVSWLGARGAVAPIPEQQRCLATAGQSSVAVDLDQAHNASIIVGLSIKRHLPPRAASIALATAYQETGIRNLNYGDRDSVGLFQQRPSQGWGTRRQLTNPYYAAGKFYDALVKVPNWRNDNINDVAQQVQRSGHPQAYRDHEADARALASTLTGRSPGGFSCLDRSTTAGSTTELLSGLSRTFGGGIGATRTAKMVTIRAASAPLAWAYASYAVANSKSYGLVSAEVGPRHWQTQQLSVPAWTQTPGTDSATKVTLTVR